MQISQPYSRTQSFLIRFSICYVLLFISSFSFPHALIPDIGSWFSPFYETIAGFTAANIFHLQKPYSVELISDSTGMYVHVFNLLFIAFIPAIIWFRSDREKQNEKRLLYILQVIVRYYLAMQLLHYGFNKVFKWQFFLPEPNTLYTSVGDTPRDLLYWTSMGSSYSYNLFSGIIEVFAALLLFFRRTQLFGAITALGIMINVFMINIGFDISVKLYSAFLIALCFLLIAPDAKRLFRFFFTNEAVEKAEPVPFFANEKYKWLYRSLKCITVLLLVTDSLYIYFESKNYNDDLAARPPMHGAYEVSLFVLDGDTIEANLSNSARWKRVFVHRRNYFIVQNMMDQMEDFMLENDTARQILMMTDYNGNSKNIFRYDEISATEFVLRGRAGMHELEMQLKKKELEKLPLFQDEFSWTVDE